MTAALVLILNIEHSPHGKNEVLNLDFVPKLLDSTYKCKI